MLGILERAGLRAAAPHSAEAVHLFSEAGRLAYADRDSYYGDPKFNNIPAAVLLSKSYAAERRKLIGPTASMDFVPGTINGKTPRHPVDMDITRAKIDDALMASDTTCVDAIDRDGIVFSATPSGAWLPSVIAGDTGIALTERAQSFILVPDSPNELAGGKRPRVTLSPTLVTKGGQLFLVMSTPGGDNQDQAMLQALLRVKTPISRLRGNWQEVRGVKLMPTFHPAYLLRSPGEKRLVWQDIQEVMKLLGMELPTRGGAR